MRMFALSFWVCAFCTQPVSRARAFQNPARFLEDAEEHGGGGERFFTGSPADGYTCKVCHAPNAPVHVDIAGLPLSGYVPGQLYPITIDWPDDLDAVGLNVEITDAAGVAAGELSVPPATELSAADLCAGGGQSGSGVFPMEQRAVALVGECGQQQTTIMWKAPAAEQVAAVDGGAGTLWFSGSLVVSDSDSSVAGDRVTDMRRALRPVGRAEPVATRVTASGCQAMGVAQGEQWGGLCGLGLFTLWLLRRQRRLRQGAA